ncbi:hypothetical protein [Isoptericola haloaureus]|uniref:Uncharacterized protein n=1 Tax=Isoptericola haloaureus TaxID=1542902 RepID=A0ABU7Z7T0_9MICO
MVSLSSGSKSFDQLRDALAGDSGLRAELENALDLNVNLVNPSDPGGRFISGGAVEWILAATAYRVGILSVPGGHQARGFDLRDLLNEARGLWSVKNQSSSSKSEYRLTNGLGGAGAGFIEPTVFLSPHLPGITYVDPTVHQEVAARAVKRSDAWVIRFKAIAEHAQSHPECVALCRIPTNPKTGNHDPGMDYTQELLAPARFPRLSGLFQDANPPTASVMGEIRDLIAMKDAGQITDSQFDILVRKMGAD